MELSLNSNSRVRISTDSGDNWLDVKAGKNEDSLEVSFLVSQQYMEVRSKDGSICSFYFKSKRHKSYHDFGWWDDAEVVFANNQVKHK